MKFKNNLYMIVTILVVMIFFSGIMFSTLNNPKEKSDILLEKRVQTQEFKKAKKNKIKNMVICYQSLEKDELIFNGVAPVITKELELYETLVIYTNEVKNVNNKISFVDYNNKAIYNLDTTKKVCRVFDINKM